MRLPGDLMEMDAGGMANRGFTLVELMIALFIGGIVMASVVTSFQSQQKTYLAQDQVVEMRQNARVAMDMLVRDIRMAGHDPHRLGAGITDAADTVIQFTRPATRRNATVLTIAAPGAQLFFTNITPAFPAWQPGDTIIATVVGRPDTFMIGRVGNTTATTLRLDIAEAQGTGEYRSWLLTNFDRLETVRFMQYNVFGGALGLGRARSDDPASLTNQPVAENIEQLAFRYLDAAGNVTAAADNIRSVQIAILARAAVDDRGYTNNLTYTPWEGLSWPPANDNRRRLMLTQTVLCRNLGL
jgi:prepilin-type N-terminal cleavage/methylation domain-containing protein